MSVCTSIFVDISNHNIDITDIGSVVHEQAQRIHAVNRQQGLFNGLATVHSYDFTSFIINFSTGTGKRRMFLCKTYQDEEVDDFTYVGDKVYISIGHNDEGIEIMNKIASRLVNEFKDLPVFLRESDSCYHENNQWVEVK